MLEADRVEQGYGTRYIRVERDDPSGDYRDMERFIGTVEDDRMLLEGLSQRIGQPR